MLTNERLLKIFVNYLIEEVGEGKLNKQYKHYTQSNTIVLQTISQWSGKLTAKNKQLLTF